MINAIIRWSIHNRFLVLVLTVFLTLGGLYSIKNTLRRVVLSESGIVGDNIAFLRARRQKLLLTFAFTGLLIAGTVGFWSFVYQQNISEFDSFSQSAKQQLLQYKNNAASGCLTRILRASFRLPQP